MRLSVAITCVVVLVLVGSKAVADADFEGVTLQIELIPSQARMEGRFEVDPARVDPASLARLRLDPAIAVDAVTQGGDPIEYSRSDAVWIELEQPPEAGGGVLAIVYGARLSAPSQARPGGGFLGEQGGFLPPGADWYPRRPDSEPHPVRIRLDVADGHLGVASGSRVHEEEDGGRYRATFEHPAGRALAVATGPWEAADHEIEGLSVRTLFPAALEGRFGEIYREQAAGYLERFGEQIGAYPFDTFTIAASPQPVGQAFSGFTLLGERVIPLPFIPHTSLGHEVLHNWWGTGVYVDDTGGNWSEGLTTYQADYAFKRERGEGREERGQWLRDYAALPQSEDRPHGDFRGGNSGAARIAGYHRGAMLWAMLEDWVGRESVVEGSRALFGEWRFREADWDALGDAFDGVTDEDLRAFFEQWVRRAGAPALELTDLRLAEQGEGWRVEGRLRQRFEQDPWSVRVPLEIKTEEGTRTHWVELETAERSFTLEHDQRPLAIAVDPDWRVFRHLAPSESPAILRQAALDPDVRVIALGDAGVEEVAPWLGRAPKEADEMEGMRILLGEHEPVAQWLADRDLPATPTMVESELEAGSGARAWAVPDANLVVISGADASERRSVAAELRHRSHYSYLLPDGDGERVTGLWSKDGVWQELAHDQ
ncbi:M1 family metallopeptidase [Thioalkalivibrio sp. ALJ1]|uniref:M1 family metallopeptidase n=1 Tax=Thioalkalivibrio sp. ALJ1 TaxID=1158144 RepID=UPI0005710C36|nr:aminopeptidase N [Thioalkalivibrio sp. ALJ1]